MHRVAHGALVLGPLAGLWWLLTRGEPASWMIGVPAVIAAGWLVQRLGSGSDGRVSAVGLIRFIPQFLWGSVRGGADVALRTLAPRMRIRPGFRVFRTRLRRRDARVFLANCLSLLPGSLTADLHGDAVELHLLDIASDAEDELRRLERAIARIFPDTP